MAYDPKGNAPDLDKGFRKKSPKRDGMTGAKLKGYGKKDGKAGGNTRGTKANDKTSGNPFSNAFRTKAY